MGRCQIAIAACGVNVVITSGFEGRLNRSGLCYPCPKGAPLMTRSPPYVPTLQVRLPKSYGDSQHL